MEYKHFSHKHNLSMYQVQPGQQFCCSGCQSLCQGSIYSCWKCNFFLHDHCGNAGRYVNHPAHRSHPLVLSPYPTYTGGSFICNACSLSGNAFSYACAPCEVDLHVHCAFLPPTVSHVSHPHDLVLSYGNRGGDHNSNASNQVCKICSKMIDSKNCWSYNCSKSCNHSAHTFCATTDVKMGLYQMDDNFDDSPAASTAAPPPRTDANQANEVEVELTAEEALALFKLQLLLSNVGS